MGSELLGVQLPYASGAHSEATSYPENQRKREREREIRKVTRHKSLDNTVMSAELSRLLALSFTPTKHLLS
jgi:hypothetical protein